MSASTANQHEDLKPAVPVFSYAQAAKGKASTGQTSTAAQKPTSAPIRPEASAASIDDTRPKSSTNSNVAAQDKSGENHVNGVDAPISGQNGGEPALKAEHVRSRVGTNTAANPESVGQDTKATIPMSNDEEPSMGNDNPAHAAEDRNPGPGSEAATDGSQQDKASDGRDWSEEKPVTSSLKEAPPPPINFWAQRMAQAPKPRPQATATATTQSANGEANINGSAPESHKSVDASSESKRRDTGRKLRSAADDRSASKEGTRSGETRSKMTNEGSQKPSAGPSAPPPPPGDAVSWPTPESAHVEERKKPQEKLEKEKVPTSKPHGKKEWQQMPFVPTVAFNTPLPQARRGGRPAGVPRDGGNRGRNTAAVENKSSSNGTSPTNQTPAPSEERGKSVVAGANAGGPQRSKRASSAGPTTFREQRKPGEPANAEKRRDFEGGPSKAPSVRSFGPPDQRKQPALANSEIPNGKPVTGRPPARELGAGTKKPASGVAEEGSQTQNSIPAATNFRQVEQERRSETFGRHPDAAKDAASAMPPPRDRGDGRPERGRGGYRGRGGANQNPHGTFASNGHNYSGGYSQYPPGPGNPGRSFSNHERLGSQQQGPFYMPPPSQNRHGRSNSRTQSLQQPFGRFSHATHNGPPHLANLQTELANAYAFQPETQGPMSAMPYNAFLPPPNLFGMVTVQMEYYFSVDNLCKDTFLRSHMTSQGFVPLSFVAGFRRIQQLTPDLELVRYVCLNSQIIEFRMGEDGTDWIRRREDWQQWVLNVEDRVDVAKNDGPLPAQPFPQAPHQIISAPLDERQSKSPPSLTAAHPPDISQFQPLDGPVSTINQVVSMPPPPPNGITGSKVPLSAAVSEFSPSVRASNSRIFSSPDPETQGIKMISDDEMEKLNITFRAKPVDTPAPTLPPFHSASSRTFSNGSIDGNSISSELAKVSEQQTKTALNGDAVESTEHPNINRSRSPFSLGSPSRKAAAASAPSVLWFKDKEHLARMNSLPSEYTHASYPVFRQSAINQRERLPNDPCVYDMQVLYDFWAHYLIRNFNAATYKEFKKLAVEDESKKNSNFGMRNLMQYYGEALLGQRTVPDDLIAADFINFVKEENTAADRPLFKKLRAAWRNGAFSHKNRAKIIKLLDDPLKAELDR